MKVEQLFIGDSKCVYDLGTTVVNIEQAGNH